MDTNTPTKSDSVTLKGKPLYEQESEKLRACLIWDLFCYTKQVTYRIPALIYVSENHTFFAFAEKRKSTIDRDADILVMKKGIWKNGGEVEWFPQNELTKASKEGYRSMNPCPIYERETKTLFLFFICVPVGVSESRQIWERKNQARLCCVKSSEPYEEWSEITDFTDQQEIQEKEKNWATVAVGPGHGLQLTAGEKKGRLIIPTHSFYFDSETKPTPYAFAIYSDDKGETWKVGNKLGEVSGECQMAEIIDDKGNCKLYCNARTTEKQRVEAISENNGEDFNKTALSKKLIETGKNGCQGSVLNILSPDRNTWLLHSHPTDETYRRDLGIHVNKSPLDFEKWENPLIIIQGPSGYSDLADCEDGKSIACLTEYGQEREIEQIAFILHPFQSSQVNSP